MQRVDAIPCKAGHGIVGDANACSSSIRQVLLASAQVYESLSLKPGALRENFLIDGDVDGLSSGQVLRVGPEVRVRLTMPCEPCSKLNHVRTDLARLVAGRRGFLGRVLTDGVVRVGDELTLDDTLLPSIPSRPRDRVYELVAHIPHGRTLDLAALVRVAGLPKSYVRAIPRFLATAPPHVPVHRVVTTAGELLTSVTRNQRRRLREEGLRLSRQERVSADSSWDPAEFFDCEAASIR